MASYFDVSKIKTFELASLSGRTLRVETFASENIELTSAFDLKTGETFVLECRNIDKPTE